MYTLNNLVRPLRWLPLFGLLLTTALSASGAVPKLVSAVVEENRNRVNFLLVGDALPDAVASRLQRAMADDFNFYRPLSEDTALALSDDLFKAKRWHGVLISVAPDEKTAAAYAASLQALARKFEARGLVVVWQNVFDADRTDAAVNFNDAARAALVETKVVTADVRGALLPLRNSVRDASGRWTDGAMDVMAQTLATSVRAAVLQRSTPWAELPVSERRDPARLLDDAKSLSDPMSLPEVKGRTAMVYRAEQGGYQFNLHSFLAHHDGKFWAVWSSGQVDEDGPSQLVRYATSVDGYTWSASAILVDDPDGPEGLQRWMANGVYVENGNLYALAARNEGIRDGMIWADAHLVRFEWTGANWKEQKVVAEDALFYFPPIKVAGRDFAVWRNSRAHFATAVTEAGTDHWKVTKIPGAFPDYRLSETAHYVDDDGVVHLIIRDQGYTRFLYHAVSYDGGATWTIPAKTNFPDGISKNYAARLSNGWFYLINNPRQDRPRERDPLAISFSRDGWTFSQPMALRKNAPPLRYPGQHKNAYSFQYSHAIEHDGKLWVIYATNKEDIEVSSYDLADFKLAQ